jgi:pimeloyl-ACP methyl ester carboxylesterase
VDLPVFAGARPPDRSLYFESMGLRLHALEWGRQDDRPIVLCHGMWDHARSFATLAPLLAERYRVIALDARGHGDSQWGDAYNWLAWVSDIIALIRSLERAVYLIGHSMGGGQATDVARAIPERILKLVNIDGFGPPPTTGAEPPVPQRFAEFLDFRQRITKRPTWRPYPGITELAERRREQNPRLSLEWLRYFSFHGARQTAEGWVWKSDPQMALGMGPWVPEWIAPGYRTLTMPMLAITGSEPDTWGPLPAKVLDERLALVPQLERCTIAGAGHFVHIEQPEATAQAISAFLAMPLLSGGRRPRG